MIENYEIQSSNLLVQVSTLGAELKRLFHKDWDKELLWSGDERIWNRTAPVLFPIVGKLKDNEYFYNGFTYSMPRHGFARDSFFICTRHDKSEIEFTLAESAESLKIYPFKFELSVIYKLEGNKLSVSCRVINKGLDEMCFSIGSHPAFNVNPVKDFEIHFSEKEDNYIGLVNDFVDFSAKNHFQNNKLSVDKKLFDNDALIFNEPKSQSVTLYDTAGRRSIKTTSRNVKHWALWAKLDAPFLCVEAWHGIADQEFHDKKIENKRDIIKLKPSAVYEFNYEIETY